jgi:hypothetical protein
MQGLLLVVSNIDDLQMKVILFVENHDPEVDTCSCAAAPQL